MIKSQQFKEELMDYLMDYLIDNPAILRNICGTRNKEVDLVEIRDWLGYRKGELVYINPPVETAKNQTKS